jgi:hypothetical protein
MIAPLGRPVVPEVYWICAAAPGSTWGSTSVGEPEAQKLSQSVNRTLSRSTGSCGRTASRMFAVDTFRTAGARKIPAARD